MAAFFELGTRVVTDIYPNIVFQIIQEDTHGWVLQAISKRCESQVMSPVMDLKEGDIVYISHSSPMSMKAVNDTEATQNDEDATQNNQESNQNDTEAEGADEVVVPASAVSNNSIAGAMVPGMFGGTL